MRIRFDALAIENGGRRTTILALRRAHLRPEASVQAVPGIVESPPAKNMVDGLPTREVMRQEPPLNASFGDVEDGIDDLSAIDLGTAFFAA